MIQTIPQCSRDGPEDPSTKHCQMLSNATNLASAHLLIAVVITEVSNTSASEVLEPVINPNCSCGMRTNTSPLGTSLLCLYFYLLCYAAVLINFTYYAQYYAHVKDLCLHTAPGF